MALEGLDGVFVEGRGKDDCGGLLDQFEHLEAVDLGHLYIEEDEIGVVLLDGLDPFEAVAAFLQYDDLRIGLQIFLYDHPGERFVVDDDGFYLFAGCGSVVVGAHVVCLFSMAGAWLSVCGIRTMVVKRLPATRVSRRSARAKRRYSLRCIELSPKPVPFFGLDVSGSKGFSTSMITNFASMRARIEIVTASVVS